MEELVKKMNEEFMRAKAKNPAYSLRAFAKKMGIQVSAISEILNEKRRITPKMAQKISIGLGIPLTEELEKIGPLKFKNKVPLDQFSLISDWHHFAILSLSELREYKEDPSWIGKRLNISEKKAKDSLRILKKYGYLEGDNQESVVRSFTTPTDVSDLSLKAHTVQTMDLARESLFRDSVEMRDFSTITMAIDPDKISEAKKMITKFRRKISDKLESGNKREVYKMSIQLFPLTKINKKGE